MNQSDALAAQTAWKHQQLMAYAVALVRVGLDLLRQDVPVFGSDDVPDSAQPDSPAIPGSACAMLRTAHVIADDWGTYPSMGIHGGRRRSKRPSANGRKVNMYMLCSIGAAEEFLRRNHVEATVQQEMAI